MNGQEVEKPGSGMASDTLTPSSANVALGRTRLSRYLVSAGVALFNTHALAFLLVTGWIQEWQWLHTFAVVLTALVSVAATSPRTASSRVLPRISYVVGAFSATLPLLVHTAKLHAHSWGGVTAAVWTMGALFWGFLPAWVTKGLMRLESAWLSEPNKFRLGDLIAGVVACIPLSGLPFWILYRRMFSDEPWLGPRRFQLDVVPEVCATVLLTVWITVRLFKRHEGSAPP